MASNSEHSMTVEEHNATLKDIYRAVKSAGMSVEGEEGGNFTVFSDSVKTEREKERIRESQREHQRAERIMYGNAYQEALKAGEARNTRIPVIIVGSDRSGKTSLKNHLLGMPFDVQQPSTDGIEVDVVEITDKNAKDAWKRENVEHLSMSKGEARKHLLQHTAQVANKLLQHKIQQQQQLLLQLQLQQQQQQQLQLQQLQQQQQQQQLQQQQPQLDADEIHAIKYFQRGDATSPVRVFLHDLAGQDIYYDTHFYFLKLQSVYIVVHDLTTPLEDVAQPRFKPSRTSVERNLMNPLLTTNLQRFLSWLTVLERLRDTNADVALEDLEDCKVPPALIALTNSDRFNGNVDEVMRVIRDILNKKGYSNVFIDFYVMDNKSSGKGKDQVRELRGKVYDLCKKMLDKQRPVPIRWLQFEAALTNKFVEEKMNFISVEEAHETGKTCNVENIEAAIKFLHHRRVIVHHPGSSVVVLNPPWLMNILTKVITVPQEDIPQEGPHRRLITKGILMQDYLERKEHGGILKELLIQFGLICPWEHADGPAFIVPSVAPLMREGKRLEKVNVLTKSMEIIKDAEELFYRNVDIRLAVKCSECFGKHNPCLDHGVDDCPHDGCGHFWFLEELEKCLAHPACPNGSIFETREFSLVPVRPWIIRDGVNISSDGEVIESNSGGVLSSDLMQRTFTQLAAKIPSKWKIVARFLGVGDDTIDAIELDYPKSVVEQGYRMLKQWWSSRGATSQSWSECLGQALCEEAVGRNDLAEEFFNYVPPSASLR